MGEDALKAGEPLDAAFHKVIERICMGWLALQIGRPVPSCHMAAIEENSDH